MDYWCFFCFFKQKTAYEMRISDWSSDVCSSDLQKFHLFPHPSGFEPVVRVGLLPGFFPRAHGMRGPLGRGLRRCPMALLGLLSGRPFRRLTRRRLAGFVGGAEARQPAGGGRQQRPVIDLRLTLTSEERRDGTGRTQR